MKTLVSRFRPEQIRVLFLLVLIALVVVFFSIQIPSYFNARFFNRESTSVAVIAVVAVGQTLVFLTRNFDLSVGSIVGFTAYFVGSNCWHHPSIPPVVRGADGAWPRRLMGAINGVLVAYGRVPSIIITIGTLAIYRSFLIEYSDAMPITTDSLPAWLVDLPPRACSSSASSRFARPVRDHDLRDRPLPAGAVVLTLRPAALRHRLEPGRGAHRRLPGASASSSWPSS